MIKRYLLIAGIVILSVWLTIWGASTINDTSNSSNDPKTVASNDDNTQTLGKENSGPTVIDNSIKDNTGSKSTSSGVSSSSLVSDSDKTSSQNLSKNTFSYLDAEDFIEYEVGKGETLASICKQYGDICPAPLLSKAILSLNKLTNSKDITTGMILKIPVKYTDDGFKYTVARGDSLYSIAVEYFDDMDILDAIEKLMKDNLLTSEVIKIGDELFIAGASYLKDSGSKAASSNSTVTNTNVINSSTIKSISYTLSKGETLATIAKKYADTCPINITSQVLLRFNDISSSDKVKEGVTIRIPEEYLRNGNKYIVTNGDTLSSIAIRHIANMDMLDGIEHIMKSNFLNSTNIKAGDELFITADNLGI